MANLIITVIAIALVAVASLMGAYYGGSAFLNNTASANAATVLNQGAQIAGAWQAYLGDNLNTPPTSITGLTTSNYIAAGSYLATVPTVPAGRGGVAAFPVFIASATATINGTAATHYFAYADLGRPATGVTAGTADPAAASCLRVQKTAAKTTITSAAQGAISTTGNVKFGCGILTGTITNGLGGTAVPSGDLTTGDYIMEYLIQ